jgi:hypothetical protein
MTWRPGRSGKTTRSRSGVRQKTSPRHATRSARCSAARGTSSTQKPRKSGSTLALTLSMLVWV